MTPKVIIAVILPHCRKVSPRNRLHEKIEQIVILMVDRNQEYKKFIVNNREFDHYTNKWKQRLIKFHNEVFK